jgi:tRNA1Val (adenine37-N6)-methyltransferase
LTSTTVDTLFGGALVLEQPRDGYRFGIDAVLLGAGAPDAEVVLDAGCGVGVVALCYLHVQARARASAHEIQSELADLARGNVERNGLGLRAEVVEGDLREGPCRSADLVLMNPPYFAHGSGGRNPNQQREAARHEVHGTLAELCRACARHMAPRARLRMIFPAESVPRALAALASAGLKVCRLRSIHSYAGSAAKLVLLDARNHGRRELEIAPMLVLYDEPDVYTAEIGDLLAGRRRLL